ncbi:MAG TPA: NAD(P)-binding domain-containing protein [Gaiellaceae bacterium]|nr:NAD(P)-binding domain-containing protein [Gaiellaceae bacterium]
MERERYETMVIGGGQSGLAVGYHLKAQGRPFVILDRSERIGDGWRTRWDSLRLYSPAMRDALPGMRFPAAPTAYPTASEMGDYLEAYAQQLDLPVVSGAGADALGREDGRFVAIAGDRRFEADNVVVATGAFQQPYVPAFAGKLDPSITQLHSFEYRNLSQLRDGPVLVVGASHSGADIAFEAASTHEVVLSGPDTGQIPVPLETRRGRLGFRVLVLVGTHVLTVDTPIGRKMRPHIRHGGGPLLRYRRKDLRAAGVERVLARTAGVRDGLPMLDDGRVLEVSNVVWCTGFRPDYSWIRFPFELDDDGYPVQYRGASSTPGLYFVGLPFLHSFASMLIAGAGRDAERVARHIAGERSTERDSRFERRAGGKLVEGQVAS